MYLHEHDAKQLLACYGVPVPAGCIAGIDAAIPDELPQPGPWVVKGQIAAGGRGKAGLVRKAATRAEVESQVRSMLGKTAKGRSVERVRIERCIDFVSELYIGLLLDARIRALTGGARSLDDVMRLAYARYSGAKGYTPEEFRAVAEEVAGASLQEFWARAIEGTAELDYAEALETFGLRFRSPDGNGGRRAWLGVGLRNDAGRLLVSQVRRDTPGAAAGLNVDDEILAIDDVRVRADRIDARLAQYSAGDKVTLLVARREQMLELPLTFGAEPERRWRLELTPTPTDAQRQARQSWAGH